MRCRLSLVLVLAAASVDAQQQARTVNPGMSRAQVIAALGEPITVREHNDYAYVFYRNTCGKTCGMNDIVVLQRDSVIDAIFRSPGRRYTGTSSSPVAIPPRVAATMKAGASAPMAIPADSTGAKPRMKPAAPNDTRPSIPLKNDLVQPAPKKP